MKVSRKKNIFYAYLRKLLRRQEKLSTDIFLNIFILDGKTPPLYVALFKSKIHNHQEQLIILIHDNTSLRINFVFHSITVEGILYNFVLSNSPT